MSADRCRSVTSCPIIPFLTRFETDQEGRAFVCKGSSAHPMTLAGNALAALKRVGLEQPFTCAVRYLAALVGRYWLSGVTCISFASPYAVG
jgi:hypothetical protein